MRIHIIACRIFARELSYLASQSANTVDITWVGRGLHNTPADLRRHLSGTVDDIYRQLETGALEHRPDAIVLAYGLCSNGVIGVQCRDIPIVIPRTDDCITLFMGSQERYLKEFHDAAGAVWLNSAWVEQSSRLVDSEDLRRRKWLEYAEKYGEDNADYLMEIESSWISSYSTMGYIHSSVYDTAEHLEYARREAADKGWRMREIVDNLRLLRMMTDGTWNEEEFLILKPGERIAPDYTGKKLRAVRDGEDD